MTDILYFAINDWHSLQQRSQHLANELSQAHRVFYIDTCYRSLWGFYRDRFKTSAQRLKRRFYGVTQIAPQLYVIDLPPLLPKGLIWPQLVAFNYRMLMPILRNILRRYRVDVDPILWVSLPPDVPLLQYFKSSITVYDCMDNYPAFYPNLVQQRLINIENKLLESVDIVFASSDGLYQRCITHNQNTHLVRNGVSPYFFNVDSKTPAHIEHIPKPRVGYIGTIGHWVDIQLLTQTAKALPDIQFVFVGPIEVDVQQLAALPNVHLLPPQPHTDMPYYVQAFDVCIIPFKTNALTDAVNPVKLYEYMALGKPIVSTPLPEVQYYETLLYIGTTTASFVDNIRFALHEAAEPQASIIKQRQNITGQHTWQKRAATIQDIMQAFLT